MLKKTKGSTTDESGTHFEYTVYSEWKFSGRAKGNELVSRIYVGPFGIKAHTLRELKRKMGEL